MKTTARISRYKNGTFFIHAPHLKSLIIGQGDTLTHAKADFENSVHEVQQVFREKGSDKYANLVFDYKWAPGALLRYNLSTIAASLHRKRHSDLERPLHHTA